MHCCCFWLWGSVEIFRDILDLSLGRIRAIILYAFPYRLYASASRSSSGTVALTPPSELWWWRVLPHPLLSSGKTTHLINCLRDRVDVAPDIAVLSLRQSTVQSTARSLSLLSLVDLCGYGGSALWRERSPLFPAISAEGRARHTSLAPELAGSRGHYWVD